MKVNTTGWNMAVKNRGKKGRHTLIIFNFVFYSTIWNI